MIQKLLKKSSSVVFKAISFLEYRKNSKKEEDEGFQKYLSKMGISNAQIHAQLVNCSEPVWEMLKKILELHLPSAPTHFTQFRKTYSEIEKVFTHII